jgi:RNA polymerase sigma factor (sigma-70 family)
MSQAAGWSTGGNGLLRRQLDRLFQDGTLTGLGDAELLRRFNARRDEAAFEALVERHGPMVLGVCRRVLGGDPGAADDAFQATFLILVRKAGALRDGERIGPWLYGVALRVARRARQQRDRRRGREAGAVEPASLPAPEGLDHEALARAELAMVLDEELGRLPEKFRAPVVLCYLEGLTHEQAAGRLSCPVGTVRSRMATARDTLRTRLARRGVTVPAGLSAAALGVSHAGARAALPPALVAATTRLALSVAAGGLASGVVPGAVSALTDGVLRTMTVHKLLIGLALGATLAATAGGGLAAARHLSEGAGAAVAQDDAIARQRARIEATARQLQAELDEARQREQVLRRQLEELRTQIRQLGAGDGVAEPDAGGAAGLGGAAASGTAPVAGGGRGAGGLSAPGGAGAGDAAVGFGRGGGLAGPGAAGGGGVASGGAGMPGMRGRVSAGSGMGGMMGGPGGMMGGGMGMPGMGGSGGMMGSMSSGMMGGAYGGMRNGVPDPSAPLMSASIITLQPKGTNRLLAHSAETGRWSAYTLPQGVTATPLLTGDLLAPHFQGESIPQLAVFSAKHGHWTIHGLDEPAQGQALPLVSNSLVAYAIGPRVYAYSAEADKWDVLELKEPAQPSVDPFRVFVESGGKLAVFSLKTGTWSVFDADRGWDEAR